MKTSVGKYIFVVFLLFNCSSQEELTAQTNSGEDIVTARNALYAEIAGRGLFLSANYERLLSETSPHNIALSAGIGFWVKIRIGGTSKGKSGVTIPVNASYLLGGNDKFELGVGFTYAPDISSHFSSDFTSDWMITTFIGYRYQPIDGGFVFRVGLGPIFGNEEVISFGGISFGYAF
jgi:hypothetical protein